MRTSSVWPSIYWFLNSGENREYNWIGWLVNYINLEKESDEVMTLNSHMKVSVGT